MADQYTLRRMVLGAVRDSEPAAAEFADVERHPALEMRPDVTPNTVLAVLNGLAEQGYLVNLRPGRDPLFRLTAKGRAQIDRETDLDEYVWGQYASKFASQSPFGSGDHSA
jgi:DNA-binding PadR family transcriptional regulator